MLTKAPHPCAGDGGNPILLYAVTAPETAVSFLRGQLAFMTGQGYAVHLLCGSVSAELEALCANEHATLHVVATARGPSGTSDGVSFLRVLRSMRSLRPHILIAGTPKMSLLTLVAARLLRVPVRIYLCHGLRFEGANGLARRTLELLERMLIASATEVVAVSGTVRDALVTVGASPARLHLIGHGSANGVDHRRFNPDVPDELAKREHCGDTPFVVLFVGRLTRDKGTLELEAIARRFAANPNILLKVIGTPEPADEEDRQRIERLTTMPGVDYIPHVVDVERAYGSADLLVLPTRREGLSTVVIEAGACGVPAVAYAATGTIDCIQDGVTGTLVPQGDHDGLIRAIEAFAGDPERAKDAGLAAARLVRARFDQPVVWELWAEFLAARREAWVR